jgi:hypothetical protein
MSKAERRAMQRSGQRNLIVAICLFATACSTPPPSAGHLVAGGVAPYDYPLKDPLAATIIGTPAAYRPELPTRVPTQELALDSSVRPAPDVLWYADRLGFSLLAQKAEAPLVFVIPGTHGNYLGRYAELLGRALYAVGFHVVTLASPTHPNFIVTSSTTGIPGHAPDDARDLYRVMRRAYDEVRDRGVEVSSIDLLGYSLGAWHAAFVSHLDETEKAFAFHKVLLINPPFSLYNSLGILDGMLEQHLAGGINNIDVLIDELLDKILKGVSKTYVTGNDFNFDSDFLAKVYEKRPLPHDIAGALIGVAFRLASSDLVFTSDVVANTGFIVPKNARLTRTTPLTTYFEVAIRTGFRDYFEDVFYPYYHRRDGATREALIAQASLASIAGYLRSTKKIGLLHNQDDFILAPGELDEFRRIFGDRARIFPSGGHMGNIAHRAVLGTVLRFFLEPP